MVLYGVGCCISFLISETKYTIKRIIKIVNPNLMASLLCSFSGTVTVYIIACFLVYAMLFLCSFLGREGRRAGPAMMNDDGLRPSDVALRANDEIARKRRSARSLRRANLFLTSFPRSPVGRPYLYSPVIYYAHRPFTAGNNMKAGAAYEEKQSGQ